MRVICFAIFASASLGVTIANGGHKGLTVVAALFALVALVIAIGGLIDERDRARQAQRKAEGAAFEAEMARNVALNDATSLRHDLRDAGHTIVTLATEQASRQRPQTAHNSYKRWMSRRLYMAPRVAAIFAARAAQEGKK